MSYLMASSGIDALGLATESTMYQVHFPYLDVCLLLTLKREAKKFKLVEVESSKTEGSHASQPVFRTRGFAWRRKQ